MPSHISQLLFLNVLTENKTCFLKKSRLFRRTSSSTVTRRDGSNEKISFIKKMTEFKALEKNQRNVIESSNAFINKCQIRSFG